MHNATLMQAVHSVDNLAHHVLDLLFGESFLAEHLVFERAECSIFVNELIIRCSLGDFEDFYDVWMVNLLQVFELVEG